MTETSKLLQVLMDQLAAGQPRDYAKPEGWFTLEDIRVELQLAYTRNASSRAADLFKRGALERIPHQFKAKTGQCHKAYVYRPAKPFKTIKEASQNIHTTQEDKVPKGFVRIVDYAVTQGVSSVAIRMRVDRAGLKPTYFKTTRGISGLHRNAYYKKAELDRVIP
jgi:hypothetical protein